MRNWRAYHFATWYLFLSIAVHAQVKAPIKQQTTMPLAPAVAKPALPSMVQPSAPIGPRSAPPREFYYPPPAQVAPDPPNGGEPDKPFDPSELLKVITGLVGGSGGATPNRGGGGGGEPFNTSAGFGSKVGTGQYQCPGQGDSVKSGAFNVAKECDAKCRNLVFDCARHRLKAGGQDVSIDGEQYLGCASQTGKANGSQSHKITQSACGNGNEGHLGSREPKLLSEPLPCDNCVIHRWYPGADTAGCLGIEPKLFDWVYQTCGGCSYTIVPMSNRDGGSGGTSGGSTPGNSTR